VFQIEDIARTDRFTRNAVGAGEACLMKNPIESDKNP
jgi:hypothetical protein